MHEMIQVVANRNHGQFIKSGRTYWYSISDFLGGCIHIYVAPNKDAWIFNMFDEDEFTKVFDLV